MALPIKPKDTQEGCNPISSNCVIWQGPDIPCIKLCTGDSVSDTVAKLAEELCTITDQLNISVLDISCFGAIAPEPGTFADVIQLLINKTCTVETVLENNGFSLNPNTSTCPDDCLVSVATCLQPTDALGNLITELPLRDYVVLIGTRICTIVSQINAINSSITNIETRITVIEQNVADIENNAGSLPTITSVGCIGRNVEKSIETFLLDFELAYCSYTQFIGDGAKVTSAINGQCTGLERLPQLANPGATMANISGWVPGAQYTTLADAVGNLWRTVCDMREAFLELQASFESCCSATCDIVQWGFTASGLRAVKFMDLFFTGSIPAGFNYCAGANAPVTIKDSRGNTGVYNLDVVANINSGAPLAIDLVGTSAVTQFAVWYQVQIPLCVSNSTGLSCDTTKTFEFYNSAWCSDRVFILTSANTVPNTSGTLTVSFAAAPITTTYVLSLKRIFSNGITSTVDTHVLASVPGGAQSYTFPGTFTSGDTYFVEITSRQNSAEFGNKEIDCITATIPVAS